MRRLLTVLIALLAAAPALAQRTQPFESDAGYTVRLPGGWERMPDQEVQALREQGAAAGMPFTLEAGYYVADSRSGLPFVLLAWMDVGHVMTPEQFGQGVIAAARAQVQAGAEGAPAPGVRIEAPLWDAENRTVWALTTMPSDGESHPFTWTATTLLSNGSTVVVFAWYGAPGEDEARVRTDLLQVVRSLRVD